MKNSDILSQYGLRLNPGKGNGMKKLKRILSALLVLCMVITLLPNMAFAAHDSSGKPLDLTGSVYLALYTAGNSFPGEPAVYGTTNYLNYNASFSPISYGTFASSAENLLKPQILDDVVEGTPSSSGWYGSSYVWGVFSTTGGSHYLTEASGLVNADGSHNEETEQKIIQGIGGGLLDPNGTATRAQIAEIFRNYLS